MKDAKKGLIYSVAGTAVISGPFIAVKYALGGFNVETFTLVWAVSGSAMAFAIVIARGHLKDMIPPGRVLFKVAAIGLMAGVGMLFGWEGLKRLDPSFSAFLWRFNPVIMILLGFVFLREKLTAGELIPGAVMIAGGCMSAVGRWNIVGTGIVFTLIACFLASLQMLVAKVSSGKLHTSVLVFYRAAIAAVVVAVWILVRGKADFDVSARYWAATFIGAFMGPCMGLLLIYQSYRYWELSRSGIVITAQPLIVLPAAYFVLGQFPDAKELAGGCVLLVGAFWLAWAHLAARDEGGPPHP